MAGAYLCLIAWEFWKDPPIARVSGYVFRGAFLLAILCAPKGRPFWFFMGVAAGAFLVGWFNLYHARSGALYNGIFVGVPLAVVGMAVLMLVRASRQKASSANP